MAKNRYTLRPANFSDQAFPCSLVTNDESCRSRSAFRVYPTYSASPAEFPDTQCCAGHLAHTVRLASQRGKGRMGGDVVRVRPMLGR